MFMTRRIKVLGIGFGIGLLFSVVLALGAGGPFHEAFAMIAGGPVVGSALGMGRYYPIISFGWLSLLPMAAHPCRPSVLTGCITVVGLLLWFCTGYVSLLYAIGC